MSSDDIPRAPATCSSHYTRSKALTEYKFAGVLPLCILHGEAFVLLGAEPVRTGPEGCMWKTMWRDFGGSRESIDEDVEATAAREFAEETLGVFASMTVNAEAVALSSTSMAQQLRAKTHVLEIKRPLKQGYYSMFITMLPHLDPMMFYLATQQNAQTQAVAGAEKTAVAWVKLEDLVTVSTPRLGRYFLRATMAVSGPLEDKRPVLRGFRCLQLHPCFASTIRAAQIAGLPELVEKARTEHLGLRLPRPVNSFHKKQAVLPSLKVEQHVDLACNSDKALKQPTNIGVFRLARASFDEAASNSASQPSSAVTCDDYKTTAVRGASLLSEEEGALQHVVPSSASNESARHVSLGGADDVDNSRHSLVDQVDAECFALDSNVPQPRGASVSSQDGPHPSADVSKNLSDRAAPGHRHERASEPLPQSIPEIAVLAEICHAEAALSHAAGFDTSEGALLSHEHAAEPSQQPGTEPEVMAKERHAEVDLSHAPEFDMSPAWRRAVQCLSETGLSVFSPTKRQRVPVQQ